MAFNLPFSVRISNEQPVDGDRYLTADAAAKQAVIDAGRAYDGLLSYQQDNGKLYMLDDISTSGWTAIATEAYVNNALTGVTTTLADLTDTTIATPLNGELLVYDDSSSTWKNNSTINGDITIIGDFYVSGTTISIDVANLSIGDNIVLINSGETGAGVTLIDAGIEVDRGSLPNYQFVFNETTETFRVGEIGSLQAVATREDVPNDRALTYWNSGSTRLDTITIDGITGITSYNLIRYNTEHTFVNDNDIVDKRYVDNALTGTTTSLAGLSDTTISTPQDNDLLIYSGSSWINSPNLWTVENSGVTLVNPEYNLILSTIEIPDDSGAVTLVDMAVTSGSTLGTENSYSFKLDGTNVMRIYSESDGAGSVTENSVVIDGDYNYMGNPTTNGSWRWFINGDGDLEFQKRVTGSWVYKTKFT